jgi:hypothetical protein
MTFTTLCEFTGSSLGVLGAILNSGRGVSNRRLGYQIWFVSNIIMVVFGLLIHRYWFTGQMAFFLFLSIRGFFNNRTPS